MSIDPATGRSRFRVSVAQPHLRVRQRVLSGRLRQQGVHLGELSHRQRAGRGSAGLHPQGVWTTQEFGLHFNTAIYRDGYLYGFDGRNEPDASLACVDAASGKVVWRETPEWTETFEAGDGDRQEVIGTVPRIAAGGRRTVSVPRRAGAPALDGSDAEGVSRRCRARGCSTRASHGRCRCSAAACCTSMQNTRDVFQATGPRLLCYDHQGDGLGRCYFRLD